MGSNLLYYGDNLLVLREHLVDESVDLIYLDPPFKSGKNYNVLFRERNGSRSAAQIQAFEDTWQWDLGSEAAWEEVVTEGGKVSEVMQAFRGFLGESDLMAYLAMMAPRLVELHRVLKETGSIYLHCDPTASHYLKILMDAVFGAEFFLNEITWKRSSAHSDSKQGMRRCGKIRDILLLYTKGRKHFWAPQYTPYSETYLAEKYRLKDPDGRRFKDTDLTAAKPGGDTSYQWPIKIRDGRRATWESDLPEEFRRPKKGWTYERVPPSEGRYWANAREGMVALEGESRIYYTREGTPRLKQYADEMPGIPLQDLWADIPPINSQAAERLGYPTQKPEALLERIIKSSSKRGDAVLDPFCGCGTTVSVAHRLGRQWIGIDITHLAIGLIKSRLQDAYGARAKYEVHREPTDLAGAKALADSDRFEFEHWALGLVGARRQGKQKKRGADQGIDGTLIFIDEGDRKKVKLVIISVKSGKPMLKELRELQGVVDRENAAIGVMILLQPPTKPMVTYAASAGFWKSPGFWRPCPRLQILTIEDILSGKKIEYPPKMNVTFKEAPEPEYEDQTPELPFS